MLTIPHLEYESVFFHSLASLATTHSSYSPFKNVQVCFFSPLCFKLYSETCNSWLQGQIRQTHFSIQARSSRERFRKSCQQSACQQSFIMSTIINNTLCEDMAIRLTFQSSINKHIFFSHLEIRLGFNRAPYRGPYYNCLSYDFFFIMWWITVCYCSVSQIRLSFLYGSCNLFNIYFNIEEETSCHGSD